MGIELDVLVGHPEYDLLFVATQVANASGLKDGKNSTRNYIRTSRLNGHEVAVQLRDIVDKVEGGSTLTPAECLAALPYPRWRDTWLMGEENVYRMLLKGTAPQSEPFRKWVTEEVLPTIRKTGKYDAAESQNPIAQGVMDELKALRGEVVELKEIIRELAQRPQQAALALPAPKSPYEGDRKSTSPT